jgi:hypothetical protein
MCKECGNCSKEHTASIDDGVDFIEANPVI